MKTLLFFLLSVISFSLFAQQQLGTDTIRTEVTVAQAKYIIDTTGANPDLIILDVRTPAEYGPSHIANAINIDYYSTTFSAQLDALDHNKMYLLHCQGGGRSPYARNMMIAKHFREIHHMYQGISAWISAGYPTVTGYTGLQTVAETSLTKLYPNPANNLLNIQFESVEQGTLYILNMQGKLLQEENLMPGLQSIDISDYASGIYLIKIQSTEGIIAQKILVQ
ncbi:MAG: T9SS type A sorting domain-containing protein [Bacteroidota bacterium]